MTDGRRRNLLWLGGAALVVGALSAGPRFWRRAFPPPFDFEPVPGVPGFRQIARPAVSGRAALMIGLDAGDRAADRTGADALRADLCGHLFGDAAGQGPVPVAYFSDIRCPWCRVLSPLLLERAGGPSPAIGLRRHALPLLDESSVLAARAELAAEAQGAGAALHARLMGTSFVPGRDHLRRIAGEIGIDGDRLLSDMAGAGIDRRLAVSRGLAALFGFPGTPALVVGRTAVLGRIEAADLDRLIALERAEAAPAPCA